MFKSFSFDFENIIVNPISEGGADSAPPLRNIALNQVIWGPGPPKLIDFS